ncbi:hypothetical protein AB0G73_23915 [Streptomyces sp. NPDC020719]|uniref:hypothetical protein n=1 Tax=Streptomyces sp. NPDC020719 TaxID=3154896 RepID=UPI003403C865
MKGRRRRLAHWQRWWVAVSLISAEAAVRRTAPADRLHCLWALVGDEQKPFAVDLADEVERIRLLWGLHDVQQHVRHWLAALDSPHMATGELADQAKKLERDIEEAAEVLRQVRAGAPIDETALPCTGAPRPADLLAARQRGDVHEVGQRFERRLMSWDTARLAPPTRWTVTAHPHRRYEAEREDGLRVWAWSALPTALESELATWNPRPGPVKVTYSSERPTQLPDQFGATQHEMEHSIPSCHSLDFDVYDAVYHRGPHAARLVQALETLRGTLRHEAVEEFVTDRLAELNAQCPQLPHLELDPVRHEPSHSYTSAVDWVDAATIVRTPDHKAWGTIDRRGPRAGAVWIPEAVHQWLDTEDVAAKLLKSLLGGPVQLHRIPGPAGPLHTLTVDGTHRTHLWRVLGLEKILAYVENVPLPIRLSPLDFATKGAAKEGTDQDEAQAAIWQGLLNKGIVRGTLDMPGFTYSPLELHSVPAVWLLYPPRQAAAYGRRYAELYPGAWEEAGIPAEAFTTAETWTTWAAGDGA